MNLKKQIIFKLSVWVWALIMLLPVLSMSQDSLLINPRSTTAVGWGRALDVSVAGTFAYVASDYSGLGVVDFSVPENLRYVASFPTISRTTQICLEDSICVIADDSNVLSLIDVSNPFVPVEISRFPLERNILTYEVVNSHIYLVEYLRLNYRLKAIDISDPLRPIELEDQTETVPIRKMIASENHLYLIASSNELIIYSLSDPNDPRFIGSFQFDNPEKVDLYSQGNFIYLLEPSGFKIVDMSDEYDPVLFFQMDLEDYGELKNIIAENNMVYISSESHRISVNLDNFADPYVSAAFETESSVPNSIDMSNPYWITAQDEGLELLDISRPDSIISRGVFFAFGETGCSATLGNYLCFPGSVRNEVNSSFIKILDISDPGSPREIGMCNLEENISAIAVRDSLLIASWNNEIGGLYLIDISNPEQPGIIATCSVQHKVNDLLVAGDIVFMGVDVYGLTAVDISNPYQPEILDHDHEGSLLYGASALSGDYAFIGGMEEHNGLLRVLNISDPSGFGEAARVPEIGYSLDMDIKDDLLFSASGEYGLNVIDISDPAEPQLLLNYCELNPWNISIYENYAIVVDENNEAVILNIADPYEIRQVASITDNPGTIKQARIESNFIYLADKEYIDIYEISIFNDLYTNDEVNFPESFSVSQAYPNPFNSSTNLDFEIPDNGNVSFTIFNTLGRQLSRTMKYYSKGSHRFLYEIETNKNEIGSGIYYIQVQYGSHAQVRPISFLK